MKIFKYIVFISILSGIFFVIYRQSDKKGFCRWWISFKTAVIIAATAAGLIPANTEAMEPPGNNNQVYQERLLSEQEFNSFEGQVILAKADGNPVTPPTNRGPSNFPTPPAGGRPSRPVYVPKYRVAPKIVDQGLGAGANLAGSGGGNGAAEFDDQCPGQKKKQQTQKSDKNEFQSDRYNSKKKKKREAEQCKLDEKIEIVYRINENPALVREAERMGKDQAAQKDVNNLIEQLALGNDNPGIGTRRVKSLKNVSEGRVYFREKDGKLEILAKSNKDNQNKVIGILQKMGY